MPSPPTCFLAVAAAIAASSVGFAASHGNGLDHDSVSSPPRGGQAVILARLGSERERLGPQSFCARANSEPVELACGLRPRPDRSHILSARRNSKIDLSFAVPVRQAFVTYHAVGRSGESVALTRAIPLERESSKRWTLQVNVAPTRRDGRQLVATVLALYSRPVRLRLGHRMSEPFAQASAEFDLTITAP